MEKAIQVTAMITVDIPVRSESATDAIAEAKTRFEGDVRTTWGESTTRIDLYDIEIGL